MNTIKELIKNNFGTVVTASASIVVALIGFLGVIYQHRKKGNGFSGTKINQKSKGNNVTMIGIQNTMPKVKEKNE